MSHPPLTEEDKRIWHHIAAQLQPMRETERCVPTSTAIFTPPVTATQPPVARPCLPHASRTQAPLPSLHPLPKREADRRFKGHPWVERTLDLHGMTQAQAHQAVEAFVGRAMQTGHRHLAIITGKGKLGQGVLRRAVPQWLEAAHLRPWIAALRYAPPEAGGEGVLHLLLKRA